MWRLGRLRSDGRQPRSAESSSPDSAARPATGWRLATLLLLFGASLMVPALVATGLLLAREARTQSEQLDRRVEQVAGDLAHDIDRELKLMTATLIVLVGAPNSPTCPSCSAPPTPRKRAWSNRRSRCATRR